MTHAYSPGLRVAERTGVRKKRLLPLHGEVIVGAGDRVQAEDVVATTDLPGDVHTVNVVNVLSIMPEDIHEYMSLKQGDKVKKGDPVAENRPFIKWFKTVVRSPATGSIESVSDVTGQVLVREPPKPVQIHAYIDGKVCETFEKEGVLIETYATFIQGIFGVGGENTGELVVLCDTPDEELAPEKITEDHKGKIAVCGAIITSDLLDRARSFGVKGIIAGGIHDKDLKELLGYDLGVAITGTENIGMSLVITEGFGTIGMAHKTFDILKTREGSRTSVSGATQIRAGVIRPEIIIPLSGETAEPASMPLEHERGGMELNDMIRVIREPFFGRIGRITALPPELTKIDSEAKVRILEAEFADGSRHMIPRANVELIEE
jgi:hypothetical protein